ncbi:MAG: Clo7bot family Cys-rich peptide [Oscillospiraceae bacterium]|nr:Clo7bot family Cys-rich peptide [Oscillospiraceae bacterium]
MKYIVKPEVEFKEGYCHICGVHCWDNRPCQRY